MSPWTPVDPDIPCRMPYNSLQRIFVFSGDSGQSVMASKILTGVLQDAAERPLSEIVGKVPLDVIGNSDVGAELERLRAVPPAAMDAMKRIDPGLLGRVE